MINKTIKRLSCSEILFILIKYVNKCYLHKNESYIIITYSISYIYIYILNKYSMCLICALHISIFALIYA